MNISQLIAQLEDLRNDFGDLDVYVASDEEGNSIKLVDEAALWSDDDGDLDDDEDQVSNVVIIWPGWTNLRD